MKPYTVDLGSPTLSEMSFDHPSPTIVTVPTSAQRQSPLTPRLTRYLPLATEEAFIGPLWPDPKEALAMIRRECPSLSQVPAEDIGLTLRFDGPDATARSVKGVHFRVIEAAWPAGVTNQLPIVYVRGKNQQQPQKAGKKVYLITQQKRGTSTSVDPEAIVTAAMARVNKTATDASNAKKMTWEDLVKRGADLGTTGTGSGL